MLEYEKFDNHNYVFISMHSSPKNDVFWGDELLLNKGSMAQLYQYDV